MSNSVGEGEHCPNITGKITFSLLSDISTEALFAKNTAKIPGFHGSFCFLAKKSNISAKVSI